MRPTPLDLEDPVELSLSRLMQAQSEPSALTFPDLSRGYVPVEGLVVSVMVHELVVIVAFLLLSFTLRYSLPGPRAFNRKIRLSDAKGVIYLPVLGGGSEGNGPAGGSSAIASKASSPTPSRSSKGRAYPGPQPILSDPVNPTNQNQTIIQPAAEKPKVLERFVPLPNLVKIAKPSLLLPPDLLSGKPTLPEFHPAVQPPAEPPKMALPATPPPAPIRPAAEKPRQAGGEKAVEPPKLQIPGTDREALASLSPTPTLPKPTLEIPLGEARGRFAISPNGNLAPETALGSKIEGTSMVPAIGHSSAAVGDAAGETASAVGDGGIGKAVGVEKSSGTGGSGTESARGAGAGAGMGTGPGTTTASGAGAGNGAGKGGIMGLTIQGGTYGGSGSVASGGDGGNVGGEISISVQRSVVSLPPQKAYGITINSTADSGGGLPELGVFSHEKVYTVFLDMRSNTSDRAPSWTLQYAHLRSPVEIQDGGTSSPSQEELRPPFPITRDAPRFNPELIRTYLHEVIVVFALMDTQGKLQRLAVKQSPDARFNPAILGALSHWIFQPAQLNGRAVPLKVLIGVPLLPYE
jgi:hypothetical protein